MPASRKPAWKANLEKGRKMSPFGDRELARRAGIASAVARRERKTLGEIMKALLDSPAPRAMIFDNGLEIFFPEGTSRSVTNAMLLSASVMAHGMATGKGDVFSTIRDTIGEKPTDKQEITGADGAPLTPPAVTVNFSKGKPDAT